MQQERTVCPTTFEVRVAESSEERAQVFAVRTVVFVNEQQVPPEEEVDTYDASATHFLAQESSTGRIIGAARLVDKGDGVGKIGRVAVLQTYRGRGVGALLMWHVEKVAGTAGLRDLILDAQLHALPFYEKLGYVAEGEVFPDAGILHRRMHKSVAR